MTPDNELRELRDTLAIEITREMFRAAACSSSARWAPDTRELAGVYRMADAVLSGRNVSKPVIAEVDDRWPNPPDSIMHCPACLNGQSFERGDGVHLLGTVEHQQAKGVAPFHSAITQAIDDEAFVRANQEGDVQLLRWADAYYVAANGIRLTDNYNTSACAWAIARGVIEELKMGGAAGK